MAGGTDNLFSNRTLDYFLVLVETMNYTKAAEKLGISQPALTQQIKKLERQTGAPMFYTTGKKLHLTEAGETVLRMTHGVNSIMHRASEEIQKTAKVSTGNIHVGLLSSLDDKVIIDFLNDYHQENSSVVVTLHKLSREELWNRLENNRLDLAIMYLPDPTIKNWTAYETRSIVMDELLFLHQRKEWADYESISIKETENETWVMYPDTYYINSWLRNEFTRNMLDFPKVSAYLSTPYQLYHFSLKSGYCTALPKSYIEANHKKSQMKAVSFDEPIEFQQAFVYRKDKLLIPRIKVFLDTVDEYFSKKDYYARLEDTH